jgi:hypothetical protein
MVSMSIRRSHRFWLLIAALTIGVFRCDSSDHAAVGSTSPPTFEIRDFSISSDSGVYTGRGTVVTLDKEQRAGNCALVLQYRETGGTQNPNWQEYVVYMSDGIGTVHTFKYAGREDQPAAAPAYE